ncbi:MAG: DNA-directed RNA polymerase subunit alpha C-terminal domain-containing protein [Taibaiella sp.]|jgi:DNA-directed RNA polymerase subunit alpha
MKIIIEIEGINELIELRYFLNSVNLTKKHLKDLSVDIDTLEFTVRTQNCLRDEGINTVCDLLKWSEVDLLKTPNIGKRSLTEIKNILKINGFSELGTMK